MEVERTVRSSSGNWHDRRARDQAGPGKQLGCNGLQLAIPYGPTVILMLFAGLCTPQSSARSRGRGARTIRWGLN